MYFSKYGIYVLVELLSGVCSIGVLDVVVCDVLGLLFYCGLVERGVVSGCFVTIKSKQPTNKTPTDRKIKNCIETIVNMDDAFA